jgi:recombinational DNA repair protein (RecF pathway)
MWQRANPEKCVEQSRRHREKYPEKATQRARRRALRKFGLTLELDLCQICGERNRSGKKLSIDHDHKSGSFRGFLCARCNLGIGFFNDSPALLESASKYLEQKG